MLVIVEVATIDSLFASWWVDSSFGSPFVCGVGVGGGTKQYQGEKCFKFDNRGQLSRASRRRWGTYELVRYR